jgi:hypothetical protein
METNWAAENLQTIRTLMERSALYRRALAPIMIFNGVIGLIGAFIGWQLRVASPRGFVFLWFTTAVVALVGSFLLVRRQALKDSEPFWSPPTRRVAQALAPAFLIGLLVGLVFAFRLGEPDDPLVGIILTSVWSCLYGCALHSAGALMPRGVRRLSWLFIIFGCVLLVRLVGASHEPQLQPHLLMAAAFSGLHLASGIYLYFTEKRGNES